MSIVTPVHDRAADLEATLRSVLLQGYPRLEYIVVDDGSTDGSAEILNRYRRWLAHSLRQEHRGLRAAINRGFEHATGDVFAYLTPDAILRPGALAVAACAVDPRRGQHIAVGRCSFVDAAGQFIGIEHPSGSTGVERILAVWKGQTVPQPSLFWTRDAWRACGPIEADRAVDYDVCCRFAARYPFHFVDRVLSSYRLPVDPLRPMPGERRGIEETLAISRRYWGRPWTLRYWRLAASLATYRFDRQRRGLALLRRSGEEFRQQHSVPGLVHGALAVLLAPEVVFVCAAYPRLRRLAVHVLKRARALRPKADGEVAATLAHLQHTDVWSDGWVGPRLLVKVPAPEGANALRIAGFFPVEHLRGKVAMTVRVNGGSAGTVELGSEPSLDVTLPLPAPLPAGTHLVEVTTGAYFVPRRVSGSDDLRPLSWQLTAVQFVA